MAHIRNPGQDRAQLLEIISSAGFEQFFPQGAEPDLEQLLAACDRYGLEMDLTSLPELIGLFGLTLPPEAKPTER